MLRKVRERLRNLRTRGTQAAAGGSTGSTPSPRAPQRMWTFGSLGRRRDHADFGARGSAGSSGLRSATAHPSSGGISPVDALGAIRTRKRARKTRTQADIAPVIPTPRAEGSDEEAVSSVPSTHISNDDFLNDAVPVEITRRTGADRVVGRVDASNDAVVEIDLPEPPRAPVPARPSSPGTSFPAPPPSSAANSSAPPSFGTASVSSRRRSMLWKAAPDGALAHAREACVARTHIARVDAAHALASSARQHVAEATRAADELECAVTAVREAACALPSTRMARFENLLFATDPQFGGGHHDDSNDVSIRDLNWKERIWDVEAMLAEQRVNAAVGAVETLLKDEEYASCKDHIVCSVESLVDEIAHLLVSACPYESAEAASKCAGHLVRLGKSETACTIVLRTAEHLLALKLSRLQTAGADLARHIQLILQLSYAHLADTFKAVDKIDVGDTRRAELFTAWATAQTDHVYRAFIRPPISHARGLDTGALLQIASAVLGRSANDPDRVRDARQAAGTARALFRARLMSNLRAHLADIMRDVRLSLQRSAARAEHDAAHVRARAPGPPREMQALAQEIRVTVEALLPVLRELPSLDEGALDNTVAQALLSYAQRLWDAVRTDGGNEREPLQRALEFLDKNAGDVLKRHRMSAPCWRAAAELLASGDLQRIAQMADEEDAGEERRKDVGVTRLGNSDIKFMPTELDDAELREKARLMLAQQRRVLLSGVAVG